MEQTYKMAVISYTLLQMIMYYIISYTFPSKSQRNFLIPIIFLFYITLQYFHHKNCVFCHYHPLPSTTWCWHYFCLRSLHLPGYYQEQKIKKYGAEVFLNSISTKQVLCKSCDLTSIPIFIFWEEM